MKDAKFNAKLIILEEAELAVAGISDEYKNPLLTWVKIVFTDDQPNANHQGVSQEEFPNLMKSMKYMPIKADFNAEAGLGGHDGALQIGVIKEGQQEGNSIMAVGALYNDEYPEVVKFFKSESEAGRQVDFSWEIYFKDSEIKDDVEWLKQTTTKAITAVESPAYEGRTNLQSISSFDAVKEIDRILAERGDPVSV